MEAQEIFDTVARHLFKQGKQSVGEDGCCKYRGQDGLKCAVGALISDGDYRPEMEVAPNNYFEAVAHINTHLPVWMRANKLLLSRLQDAHDDEGHWATDQAMRKALAFVARMHDLDASILDTLSFSDR